MCGISVGSGDAILNLNDTNMRGVASILYHTCLLEQEQRMLKSSELFVRACENVNFIKNIITKNKSWAYGFNKETKRKTFTSLTLKKARQVQNKTKVMLLVFYDCRGFVYHEYAPPGKKGSFT